MTGALADQLTYTNITFDSIRQFTRIEKAQAHNKICQKFEISKGQVVKKRYI